MDKLCADRKLSECTKQLGNVKDREGRTVQTIAINSSYQRPRIPNHKLFAVKEMTFNEGDLLYVSDSCNDSNWLTARCGDQTGLIPRSYVMNAEYIDYPLHDAAKRGNAQFVTECLSNAEAALASDLAWDEASAWSGNGKKSTKNGKKSFGALILSEIMLTKFSRLHFPAS
ncbi:Osteoclast-stimulating factor 1 [Toxocara canis]|uniref:Osteoclast-stimulating factor 1 n=1 Tax=Toxocara canis TaxID=6265 RepID=A0A0B2VKD9_TOXCA|nr:Osteoclast-stimulating factor 1 [Toxocara canis]